MTTIKKIEQMMKEPASKEWFARHGMPKITPKSKALEKRKVRLLTPEESREKTKSWPKSTGQEVSQKEQMNKHKENSDYQKKFGRAWND